VRWDGVILGGDVLDMDAVSFWEAGKPGLQEGKRLSDEYDAGNSWLANLEYAARRKNKDAKIWYCEGNHENRVERDLERNPRYRGLVDVPVNMNLAKRKIQWVRSWSRSETVKIGKMEFMHGDYTTDWHAKKHVIERGCSVGYGHTHSVQSYPLQYRGRDRTIQGKSYGCLCDYELSYMRGRPNKWQQAFGEIIVQPDGFFQEWDTKIFKHRFVGLQTGKTYDGR
jgi:hypothetical protein